MAEERVHRRLAAILAADVVGYSRLIEIDEEGTLARLKTLREELIEPIIAENRGRLVKLMGDGALVEFASAVDAVRCAVETQRGVAAHNDTLPADQRIAFRIGVNLGDIVIDGDDILGDGVNIAARLEGLAEPGGISVSDAVFKNVRGRLGLGFADLGPRTVKNITEPVRVFRVLLDPAHAGQIVAATRVRFAQWRWPAAVAATILVLAALGVAVWRPWAPVVAEKPTIAVLRFTNLSGEADQEHLGRGIAGDLFTDLSKNAGVLVAAWEASSRINPSKADLRDVGRRLNVAYVLTGDIRRVDNALRVSVRLVDTNTLYNLWAARYDRSATEIFALQDDVTGKVAAALKLKLTPADKAVIEHGRTTNPAAYDKVLQARADHLEISPKASERAIALYRQAIELDPNYAQAYAELAYEQIFYWFITGSSDRWYLDRGREDAQKALAIDPSLASAHVMLGWHHLWTGDHAAAIREIERAAELDPNNGETLSRLSLAYMFAGQPTEGLNYILLARSRTTFEPQFYGIYAALCYFYLDRLDDAVRELKRSIALNSRQFVAHRVLAVVYAEMGRMTEARAAMAEALRLNPRLSISLLKRQLPFKNPADLERQFRALRTLGFPE